MRYRIQRVYRIKDIKSRLGIALSALGLVLGAGALPLTMVGSASAATNMNGCDFAVTGTTWILQSDCSSTAQIDVPANVTLNGAGYTISPTFTKTSNENNAAIGLGVFGNSNNVTIDNLTIDGTNGTYLHGINVYVSTGVVLNDVTLKNNGHDGLVVDGANVTVNNITTMNNGWGGIDVDQGSGVTTPAVLTVNGTSTQFEVLGVDIYVDHYTTKNVSVVDTNSQYVVRYNVFQSGDAVYTQAKDACMFGGWTTGAYTSQSFKNQGACVSYVASNGKSQH